MKKKLLIFCLFCAVFLGFFELYLFYLQPNELTLSGYFASMFQAAFGGASDKLIRINLATKDIALYENGGLIKQDKISAAGHPRATPTPTGDFKISYKSKKVISFTGLIMPLSLRFSGHYYLHGLPTTKNGQIYSSVYSNGCIRLPAGFDQEVFNWADIGTRVQIFNTNLVKSAESPTVYVLTAGGLKEPIPSPEVFESRGFKWKNIATVPLAELVNYSTATSTNP